MSRRRKETPVPRQVVEYDEDEDDELDLFVAKRESEGPLLPGDRRQARKPQRWPEGVEIKNPKVWYSLITRTRRGMERRTRCIGESMTRGQGAGRPPVRGDGGVVPSENSERCEEELRRKALTTEVNMVFETALIELGDEAVRIELEPLIPSPIKNEEWMPLPPLSGQIGDLKFLQHVSILGRTYRRRRDCDLEVNNSMSPANEVRRWLNLVNGNTPPRPSKREEIEAIRQEALDSKAVLDKHRASIEARRSLWIQETAEDPSEELRRMDLVTKFEDMKANILKEKPLLIEEARMELEERRRILSKETMEERVARISKIYEEAKVGHALHSKLRLDRKKKNRLAKQKPSSDQSTALCQEEEPELIAKKVRKKEYAVTYIMMAQKMEAEEYKLFLTLLPLLGVTLVPDETHGPHIYPRQHPRFIGLRFPPPSSVPDTFTVAEHFEQWVSGENSVASIEYWSQKRPHFRTPEAVWAYRRLLAKFIKRRKQDDVIGTQEKVNEVKTLKDLVVKDGHEILRHLTYKRFYTMDKTRAYLSREENCERMKAYQRMKYNQRKHGVTLELGEYLKDHLPGVRRGKRRTGTGGGRVNDNTNQHMSKAKPGRQKKKNNNGDLSALNPKENAATGKEPEDSQTSGAGKPRSQGGSRIKVTDEECHDDDDVDFSEEDGDNHEGGSMESVLEAECGSSCDEAGDEEEAMDDAIIASENSTSTEGGGISMKVDFHIDSLLQPLLQLHPQQPEILHDTRRIEHGASQFPLDQGGGSQIQPQSTYHQTSIPTFLQQHHLSHYSGSQGLNYHHPAQPNSISGHPDSARKCDATSSTPSKGQLHEASSSPFSSSSFANENDDDDDDSDPQPQKQPSSKPKSGRGRPKGSKNGETRRDNESPVPRQRHSRSRDIWSNRKRRKYHQHDQPTFVVDHDPAADVISTTILPIASLVSRVHENATVCLICGHEEKDPKLLENHLSTSHPVNSSHDDGKEENNSNHDKYIAAQTTTDTPTVVQITEQSSKTDANIEGVEEPAPPSKSSEQDKETETQKSNPCKCKFCSRSVDNPSKLIVHVLRSHFSKNMNHKCPFQPCDGNTSSLPSLEKHIKRYHRPRSSNVFVLGSRTAKTYYDRANEFHCTSCALSFDNRKDVEEHYKDFHEKRWYGCPRCGLLLKMEIHLTFHLQLFHSESTCKTSLFSINLPESESSKKCKICLCEFTSNCYLLRHLKAGHDVNELVTSPEDLSSGTSHCEEGCRKLHDYLCCFCGEEFEDKETLRAHISSSQGHVSVQTAPSESSLFPALYRPFKCELCPRSSSDFYILLGHSILVHGLGSTILNMQNQEGQGGGDKSVDFEHDVLVEDAEMSVLIAAAAAAAPGSDQNWKDTPQSLPSLSCGECGDDEDSGLNTSTFHEGHLKYNSLIVKTCEPCDRIFSRPNVLPKHLEAHHGIHRQDQVLPSPLSGRKTLYGAEALSENQFVQCSNCKIFFTSKEFHKIHTLLKKDPDVRKCTECNLTFPNPPKYLDHRHAVHGLEMNSKMRTNQKNHPNPEKPIKITKIDARNVDSCFVHSTIEGISVYSCKVCCNRHFKTRDFVVKHILESHEADQLRFHCDQCNFSASKRAKIGRHQKVMHSNDVTLYQCPFCSMSGRYKNGVTNHVKKVHGEMERGIFTDSMIQVVNTTLTELRKEKEGMELCVICQSFFRNKKALKGHLATHGIVSKDSTWCDVCGLQLSRAQIQKHVIRLHPEVPPPSSIPDSKTACFPMIKIVEEVQRIYQKMEQESIPFDRNVKIQLKLGSCTTAQQLKEGKRASLNSSFGDDEDNEDDAEMGTDSGEDGANVEIEMRKMPKRIPQERTRAKRRKKDSDEIEKVSLRRSRRNLAPINSYNDTLNFESRGENHSYLPPIQIKAECLETTSEYDFDYIPSEPQSIAEEAVKVTCPYDLKNVVISLERCDALVEQLRKNQFQEKQTAKVRKATEWEEKYGSSKPGLSPQTAEGVVVEEGDWMSFTDDDDDRSIFTDEEEEETFTTTTESKSNLSPTSLAEMEIEIVTEEELESIMKQQLSTSTNSRRKKGRFIKVKEIADKNDDSMPPRFTSRYLRLLSGQRGNLFSHYGGFRYRRLGGRTEKTDPSEPQYFVCVVRACKATLILHQESGVVERAGVHENHPNQNKATTDTDPPTFILYPVQGEAPCPIFQVPIIVPPESQDTSITPQTNAQKDSSEDTTIVPSDPASGETASSKSAPLTASELFMMSRGKKMYYQKVPIQNPMMTLSNQSDNDV